MDESAVLRLIHLEPDARNAVMLHANAALEGMWGGRADARHAPRPTVVEVALGAEDSGPGDITSSVQ